MATLMGLDAVMEVVAQDARREVRVYLTVEDIAEMAGLDPETLSISHVDHAPDQKSASVRVCLIQTVET